MEVLKYLWERKLKGIAALLLALVLGVYIRWRKIVQRVLQQASVPVMTKPDGTVGIIHPFRLILANYHRVYDYKVERSQHYGSTYIIPPPIFDPVGAVTVINSDPEIVKYILKDNFNNYVKRGRIDKIFSDLLGKGIFTADHDPKSADKGKNWYFQRKTASKIFTRNIFNHFVKESLMKNCNKITKRLDKAAANKETIDLQDLLFKFTMDTIGLVGFGIDLNTLEKEHVPFAAAFDNTQRSISRRFLRPGWETIFGYLYKEERDIYHNLKILNSFCEDVIMQRRGDPDLEKKGDILSLFMQSEGELSDTMLRDIIMSFFIAGRDTTACTLSFAMLIMTDQPEIQEKLFKELHSKFSDEKKENFSYGTTDMSKENLPYLHGVVYESLRMYPPVPVDIKTVAEDDVLPNGQHVKAGDRVSFEPYVMGRLNWEDGNRVIPERWQSAKPSQFEFPQFQAGPRICLGQDFAVFEAKYLLSTLIRRYKFTLEEPIKEVPYTPGVTMTVNGGLKVSLEARA